MTTGTKVFRIIISALLSLCILATAVLFIAIYYLDRVAILQEDYGVSVAGVLVTRENKDDIFGDGTVFYDADNSTLVFADAEIQTDGYMIASTVDLGICLLGDNKFIATGDSTAAFISVTDFYNAKDLYIYGDGSLAIEYRVSRTNSAVIQCADLNVLSDITLTTPDCTNLSNGIVCDSSFKLMSGATITLNGGSAKSLMAFRVRGNALLEAGTTINVSVKKGSTDAVKAMDINGDLVLGDGASVSVSVAEDTAELVECICVNGLLEVGEGATLTATTAKSYAVECGGAIKLCDGAVFSATSADGDADAICYGAVVDYGATVNGDLEALGQIHDKQ